VPDYIELGEGGALDPRAVVESCIESDARSVLADESALPPAFFDLGTGLAGELLHKLSTYRLRLAGIVPDASVHPTRFQEFLREANRGDQFRFFTTRDEAIQWLLSP
jgi:hypothetical protein